MADYCDFILTLKADNINNLLKTKTPLTHFAHTLNANEAPKSLDFESVVLLDEETASINAICVALHPVCKTTLNLVSKFCAEKNFSAKLAYVIEGNYCGVATFSDKAIETHTKLNLPKNLELLSELQKTHQEFETLLESIQ